MIINLQLKIKIVSHEESTDNMDEVAGHPNQTFIMKMLRVGRIIVDDAECVNTR